jgi:hypothetical protein
MIRRRALLVGPAAAALGAWPLPGQAGRQAEEPLADAVRTALAAAVADSGPP